MSRKVHSTFFQLTVAICVCLLPVVLRADVTATILGNARDTTGAPLPHAKITVTNVDTNLSRTTVTDATGEYRFLSLPAGTYTVEAELDGFQKFVAGNIVLSVDQQRRVDIPMQVGSLQQRVEVSAAAVQVETTNTQLGTVIDEKNIVNLPLNGRSYIDLLSIQAGVAPTSGTGGPGLISVNGQRQESNSFLVNGGDVNEGRRMTAGVVPNLDSVAEFRLITNSFDAEYGRFSGAVMNAITKSGTNGLHGAAFEFLRNSNMDARAFFDPAVTVLKRNQFGYAVGGPALKNRLFWFTDYQGTRERRGTSGSLSQLPSVAQRSGVFSSRRPEWRSERPVLGAGADQASGLRRLRQRALQHAHVRKYGGVRLPGRSDSHQRDLADLGQPAQELHPRSQRRNQHVQSAERGQQSHRRQGRAAGGLHRQTHRELVWVLPLR